jgi:hypothetical protein
MNYKKLLFEKIVDISKDLAKIMSL